MIPRFDFFDYTDRIKELISGGFSILETVVVQPSKCGNDERFADVAVPAFLMEFEDTGILGGAPLRDEEGAYYLDIQVNVAGVLLLPKFTDGLERNLNMAISAHQAGTNIAALIYAGARGWNCGPAEIKNIEYEPDENYHIVHVEWSHKATVGRDEDELRRCFEQFIENYDGDLRITTKLGDPDV